jgi:integral membrane sensor domain MASE1
LHQRDTRKKLVLQLQTCIIARSCPKRFVAGVKIVVNTIAAPQIREQKSGALRSSFRLNDFRSASISILVGIAYYVGAKMGFALTFKPHPVSVMWLPNSILLAAFVLMPVSKWWLLLLTAFPAHIAVELGSGVPWTMVLCWFISNCFEAVFGAAAMRIFSKAPIRFDSFRNLSAFFLCGALIAPLLSSFLDSGFVMLNRYGIQGYWEVWRLRFFSNICSSIILVPMIVAWCNSGPIVWRNFSVTRLIETFLLASGFLLTSVAVFTWLEAGVAIPALRYHFCCGLPSGAVFVERRQPSSFSRSWQSGAPLTGAVHFPQNRPNSMPSLSRRFWLELASR